MKKLLLSLLTLVLFFSSNQVLYANDETIINSNEQADVLTQNYGVTSIQYALLDNGEIVTSGNSGVYSKTENRALTPDVMYGIGSTSKMFTTAAVMKLVDEGKIELDAPVTRYIPNFKMADKRYRQITVRMLLNHSSGLMGSTYNSGFLYDDNDTRAHDSFLNDLSTQMLKADPGAFSVYSNDSFTLAEILVEKVSHMSFTEYLHQAILKPLGLLNTKTPQDEFNRSQLARTYKNGLETPNDTANIIGSGGIYSSAEDLVTFGAIFTKAGTLLSEQAKEATMQKEYLNGQWLDVKENSFGYGLGWDCVELYPFSQYGIRALKKGGDTLLMHNALIVLPDYNMVAAVSSSGGSSMYNEMIAVQMLLNQLKAKGIIDEIIPMKEVLVPKAVEIEDDLRKYEGLYGSSTAIYRLSLTENELILANAYAEENALKYTYTGNGIFKNEYGTVELAFLEQEGNVYLIENNHLILNGIGDTVLAQYTAQKLEDYQIPEKIKKSWDARENNAYLLVNEKQSSQVYEMLPAAGIAYVDGYLVSNKIVDKNKAVNVVEIPVMAGRDTRDYVFYRYAGVEYMQSNDSIYMDMKAINQLNDDRFTSRIRSKGYTQWYRFDASYQGKTMNVAMDGTSGFVVYDSNGLLQIQCADEKNGAVVLPAGGYIGFIGDAFDRFKVEIK